LSRKPTHEAELKRLLEMEPEAIEALHGRADVLFPDVLKIGPHSILMVQDQCLHLINPGNSGISAVARVIVEIKRRNLPLTALFLTTSHPFYATELYLYRMLAAANPELFSFKVFTHQKNQGYAEGFPVVTFSSEEEFLKLGGRRYFVVHTPGNRREADQVTLMDMKHKLLFLGELLQPQGESYDFCTFVTPVPDHVDPDAALSSIQNLKSLPFEHSFCVNGQLLDRSRTWVWMDVTQRTLERVAWYCRKVLWEEDSHNFVENAKSVLLKVAMERNMSLDLIYQRFEVQEGSSDFQKYDMATIAHYLRKFGMQEG
jgi:hypothetical protein